MKKDPFIKSGLFGYGPYVALCLSEKEFVKITKGFDLGEFYHWIVPNSVATAHALESKHRHIGIVCIDLTQVIDRIDLILTIVHESVHIWQRYLIHVGEPHPGHEVEAYCIQRLVEIFLQEYERKKPKEQ